MTPIVQLEQLLMRLQDLRWTSASLVSFMENGHVQQRLAIANHAITMVIRLYEHALWQAHLTFRRVFQDHFNRYGRLPCMDEI